MSKEFEFVRLPWQAKGPLDESAVLSWEAGYGYRLPSDYRAFLLKTNGGALRPNTFDLPLPNSPIAQTAHAVTRLFDWTEVLKASQDATPAHLRTIPPGHIAIGATSTDLRLLLSTQEASFGSINAWIFDPMDAWGDGSNTMFFPVARGFSEFLESLRHDTKGETYQDYWADHDNEGLVAARVVLP